VRACERRVCFCVCTLYCLFVYLVRVFREVCGSVCTHVNVVSAPLHLRSILFSSADKQTCLQYYCERAAGYTDKVFVSVRMMKVLCVIGSLGSGGQTFLTHVWGLFANETDSIGPLRATPGGLVTLQSEPKPARSLCSIELNLATSYARRSGVRVCSRMRHKPKYSIETDRLTMNKSRTVHQVVGTSMGRKLPEEAPHR
jgi:hypothetical protein